MNSQRNVKHTGTKKRRGTTPYHKPELLRIELDVKDSVCGICLTSSNLAGVSSYCNAVTNCFGT